MTFGTSAPAGKTNSGPAGTSLALHNLRTFVIFIVLAFHSFLAYLGSSPPTPPAFDAPPFGWRSIPIIDNERWFGFDLFCAHQDVYLISLLFLLSGLFVWPSLRRKGTRVFVRERFVRIGLPFLFAVVLVMPPAIYPVYLVTAQDPSISAYWEHLLALPFWPSGPPWFLWVLLVFDLVAAALFQFARRWGDALGRITADPALFTVCLMAASAVAYIPLALIFTPWDWWQVGPFAIQYSRPLHYAVYFFAGVAIGAYGIDRGLLAKDGWLYRHWAAWLGAAVAMFALWLGMTALAVMGGGDPPLVLSLAQALAFVLACGTSCLFVIAAFLRFGSGRLRPLAAARDSAYGMYLIHYVFVMWLQYLLLGAAIFAILKGMLVFAGTLALSWGVTAAMLRIPTAARLIGSDTPAPPSVQPTAL